MNELKRLNIELLKKRSKQGNIGCPFSILFNGPVEIAAPRPEREVWCSQTCGKLFLQDYQPNKCPCWYLGRNYAKERFWSQLRELIEGGETTQ